MSKIKVDVKITKDLTNKVKAQVDKNVSTGVKNIAQDLARASSGATPHLKGDLSGSYSIEYSLAGKRKYATVEYSVYNKGFNYAIAMHEWTYNLGKRSRQKSGGRGMSGRTYKVGNKFLTRVLKGETKAYRDYVGKQVNKAVR